MSRKHCRRQQVAAVPPRGLLLKLRAEQVRTIALAHIQNLDAIATGQAGGTLMWEWVESVLTWSRVAELLQVGLPEMDAQLALATRVTERFQRTGMVELGGGEYQAAALGVTVMDQLAEIVDVHTANAAALWSRAILEHLRRPNGGLLAPCEHGQPPPTTTV